MQHIDICEEYFKVWQEMEGTFDLSFDVGKIRKHENCIRPSQFKRKTVKTQLKYFFDPHLLEKVGFISYDEAVKLHNSSQMDAFGKLNCTLGTILHEIVLPQLEDRLRVKGINAVTEYPLISREYCSIGTADLMVFHDAEKLIDVYDLKTTGPGMLRKQTNASFEYQLQLLSYAKMLEDVFEDYKVNRMSIIYACKTPSSSVTEECLETGQLVKYQLPIVGEYIITYEDLKQVKTGNGKGKPTLEEFFIQCVDGVKELNGKIKNKVKGYDHWLFNDKLWNLRCKMLAEKLEERGYE